jgi:peptide/nickel transport system ATP-binding protein
MSDDVRDDFYSDSMTSAIASTPDSMKASTTTAPGSMTSATTPTLEVRNLRTHFTTRAGVLKAVDDVSFSVAPGRVLGLVGESGSGKSVTGFSIMGLVDPPGKIVGGEVLFEGRDLTRLTDAEMRELRGNRVAMIFQDPMMTLNPVLRIGTQIVETLHAHARVGKAEALERAREALAAVGIPAPEERLHAYPHEFSGGMRQRVAIAIALLHQPALIIADEPTTALDVTIQAQILSEIQKLARTRGTAIIWISHDLSVVSGLADDIAVMYAGRIVEQGPVGEVLARPAHPYTVGLVGSVASHNARGRKLTQIRGMPPHLLSLPPGCPFRPRCDFAVPACEQMPAVTALTPNHRIRCFNPRGQPRPGSGSDSERMAPAV